MKKHRFISNLLKLGVVAHHEHETLWELARRCAATTGLTMGIPTALMTARGGAGPALAGFLAGLATGTLACVAVNKLYVDELRRIAAELN